MSRKFYFGSNTKMSKTDSETVTFLQELVQATAHLQGKEDLQLFIIPSFTVLNRANAILEGTGIRLGAQNLSYAERGQFTGEVSPLSLLENGVSIAEIGHSERRHVLGETDEDARRKVENALSHGMTALLCIGETGEEKAMGLSAEVLRTQLKVGLSSVTKEQLDRVWVAYEPVWAIGTQGTPAAPDYVEKMHGVIKQCLVDLFGCDGGEIPVLYGGSVNPANHAELAALRNVDGLFVGRSAWFAQGYASLAENSWKIKSQIC